MGRCLVPMAVEAVDHSSIAFDNVLHRGADRNLGVDVPGGIMASSADTIVCGQDIWPVLH